MLRPADPAWYETSRRRPRSLRSSSARTGAEVLHAQVRNISGTALLATGKRSVAKVRLNLSQLTVAVVNSSLHSLATAEEEEQQRPLLDVAMMWVMAVEPSRRTERAERD